jgi:tetratricopeptide (TPR) repeat protein/Zn-dependent protease
MSDLMLAIAVLLGWIAAVCLHEFGHALVAYYGGDITVKDKGYLTLNPLKYTDVGYSLVMPVVFLVLGGIALPGAAVYINTKLLRSRAWQSAVSAAGPLATAVVAIALAMPFKLGWATANLWAWNALALLITLQVAGFFFNLLPIPSFDGFGILEPWLPQPIQHVTQRWGRYGYWVLLALFWTVPAFNQGFWGLVGVVAQELLSVPQTMMFAAYTEFAESSKVVFAVGLFGVLIYRKLNPAAKKNDRPEDSETALTASNPRSNHLIETQQAIPETWFERGQTLSSSGQFDDAIASYDMALKEPNPKAEVWYGRAIALHQTKRYPEALADYEQTLALAPNHSYAWANKARILRSCGDFNASMMAYDRSLKARPTNASCWHERGALLRDLGQMAEAALDFETALRHERENAALWIEYAELLCTIGQPDKAISSYRRALRLDPENIAVWRSQGNLYLQRGQAQNALRCYSTALSHSPQDSALLLLRGLTFHSLKRFQLALEDFEAIQALLLEDLKQPEQAETLCNLSPTLKPVVQRFASFSTCPAESTSIVIAQALLLTILQRPHDALAICCNTPCNTSVHLPPQSPELQYLKRWVQGQI